MGQQQQKKLIHLYTPANGGSMAPNNCCARNIEHENEEQETNTKQIHRVNASHTHIYERNVLLC